NPVAAVAREDLAGFNGLWGSRHYPPGGPNLRGEPACRAAAGLAQPRVFTRDAEEPPMLPLAEEQIQGSPGARSEPRRRPPPGFESLLGRLSAGGSDRKHAEACLRAPAVPGRGAPPVRSRSRGAANIRGWAR